MNLDEGDFEFIFNLYDEASNFISDKDKPEYARRTIYQLLDFGFELKPAYKEIADHCEYLGEALDEHLEQEEEDEDVFDEYNEDDEEYEY
jgi:DNA-binding HxlR family transcriptional regulator